MESSREDARPKTNRAANVMAAAALFIALSSGAYAASIGPNTIGAKQIQANAVGSSEMAQNSVGPAELKAQAVDEAALAPGSVSADKLKAQAVNEAALAAQSVGASKIKDAAVGEAALAPDSIGAAKLKAQAVNEAALAADSVSAAKLKAQAVNEAALGAQSVSQQKLKDAAVGETQLAANSVNAQKIQDGIISQQKMAAGAIGATQLQNDSIGAAKLQAGSVGLSQLTAAATPTLYTDINEPDLTINSDTAIAALSLPAGSYLVSAGVQGVHTGTAASTRLECYLAQTSPAATLDFAKVRLQPNVSATDSLVFTKVMLQGATQLPSSTGIAFRCTTTGVTSTIDLSYIRMTALRIPTIVSQ